MSSAFDKGMFFREDLLFSPYVFRRSLARLNCFFCWGVMRFDVKVS